MIPMEDPATVGGPGWVPLVIVIVMFIAVFFLGRSMRRMLRTIDPELPHKGDVDEERSGAADEQVDATEERAVDRARRGEVPAGTATGLVTPHDHDESGPPRT